MSDSNIQAEFDTQAQRLAVCFSQWRGDGKTDRFFTSKQQGNIEALIDYWTGRMGQPGDFDDCVQSLSQHEDIDDPEALCNWMHQQATGEAPGQHTRSGSREIKGRKKQRAYDDIRMLVDDLANQGKL
jgi:hypothetical protein